MDSVDLEVLRSAESWLKAGHRGNAGHRGQTWGSAPRPVGAMLAIRDDGQVVGLGLRRLRRGRPDRARAGGQLAGDKPEVATYGVTKEQADRFGLPCGGTLQLVLEPVRATVGLDELLGAVERHELVGAVPRHGDRPSDGSQPGQWSDALEFDGKVLKTVHGPRWRLLIIGAGAAVALSGADGAGARLPRHGVRSARGIRRGLGPARRAARARHPDDVVLAMNAGCAQRGGRGHPRSQARRRGAAGSAQVPGVLRRRARFEKPTTTRAASALPEFDLSAGEIARLHGPVGLKIGSKTPPEIAVAILAEMTAVRHGVQIPQSIEPPKSGIESGCGVPAELSPGSRCA